MICHPTTVCHPDMWHCDALCNSTHETSGLHYVCLHFSLLCQAIRIGLQNVGCQDAATALQAQALWCQFKFSSRKTRLVSRCLAHSIARNGDMSHAYLLESSPQWCDAWSILPIVDQARWTSFGCCLMFSITTITLTAHTTRNRR